MKILLFLGMMALVLALLFTPSVKTVEAFPCDPGFPCPSSSPFPTPTPSPCLKHNCH